MRILLDMDGVLAEWDTEFDRCLDQHGQAAAGIPRKRDRVHWDLKAGRTPEEKRIITKIMAFRGFYSWLKPIPGALEAAREMLRMGHDVRIVTSPWASNPTCASDKLEWVRQHLGQDWGRRVVITNDKTVVAGDVLVDDKPTVSGTFVPQWRHILFDQPYNVMLPNRDRIRSWEGDAWRELLLPAMFRPTAPGLRSPEGALA